MKSVTRFCYGDSLPAEGRLPGDIDVYGSNGIVGQHDTPNTGCPCLIVGRKGSFGKVTYSEKPCFAIDTTYYIDSTQTKHRLRWVYYCLQWLRLDSISKDSAVPGLAREDAYEHVVPFCDSGEQLAVSSFLDRETGRIDALIERRQKQIRLLQEDRVALISHAVTKGLNPKVTMKDSGIEWLGEIPEHWQLTPLKFLLLPRANAVKTGPFGSQLLSSEMMEGPIKVYNQRNVLDRDFSEGNNYISEDKYTKLKAFTICPGDILITTRGSIGRCALFPDDAEKGILHPCLMRIQADKRGVLPEYLVLLLQDSKLVQLQLLLMSNATTIDVIYSDSLKSVHLPIPPVREQSQILSELAENTFKLERLMSKVSDSIDILREYRTALISAVVTGKIDVRKEVVA